MTLEQAIVILELAKNGQFVGDIRDLEKALKIGIEACYFIYYSRLGGKTKPEPLLPSETKE